MNPLKATIAAALVALLASCPGLQALSLSNSANGLHFASEMGVKADNHAHNVLERPTVGVMVVVDGEGPLVEEEWTPFFKTLRQFDTPAQSWRDVLLSQEVNKARQVAGRDGFALGTSAAEEEDHIEVYWRTNKHNKVEVLLRDPREDSGKHLVVVEEEQIRLDAELGLIEKLVENAVKAKEVRPVIIYATVFGLKTRNDQDRSKSFSQLSSGLEKIFHSVVSGSSRPLFTVLFTEKKQGPAPKQITELEVAESRRLQSTPKREPFQGSDYVIMFWTIVAFMILTFFVICCIPWAPTLDPALRSTLKQDNKRD